MRAIPGGTAAGAAIRRIRDDYAQLAHLTTRYSLINLFRTSEFDFAAFCADYTPHPDIPRLKELTRDFGNRYQILLPDADYYITCSMFLFPKAPFERILLISKLFAVDFYLNDTMGRDAQPTDQERRRLYEIRDRLARLGYDLNTTGAASAAEKANIEVLELISRQSPDNWFTPFLQSYLQHIDAAHRPNDVAGLGYIPAVNEYVEARRIISGMPHTVFLVEYANGTYLDWELLTEIGLDVPMQRINWTVSVIGALTNDLFSFEKEVIDKGSDANLLSILVMNNFRMKLSEAIGLAGSIIRDLLADYVALTEEIDSHLKAVSVPIERKAIVYAYLEGLKTVLQTCWLWQATTMRYKRPVSIWKETAIQQEVTA